MIARPLAAALHEVDLGASQARRQRRREQEEVHAKAGVAAERVVVDPEGVYALGRMEVPRRIDPALREQPFVQGAGLGLEDGVEAPEPRVVDVGVGRHDVEIAGQDDVTSRIHQRARVRDQSLEPGQLEIELRPRLRIAVWQVDRRDPEAEHVDFEIARLQIARIAGQAAPHFARRGAAREDGDAVMGALSVPDRTVAGRLDRGRGERRVAGLDLLQAGDVGTRFVEPLEQPRQPPVDSVDVEGRDLQAHRSGSSGAANWAVAVPASLATDEWP